MKINPRMLRGKEIYNTLGQIKQLWQDIFYVKSQSGHGVYTVSNTPSGWVCDCADHRYRMVECKHIWAIKFFLKIKAKIRESHIIEPLNAQVCPQCGLVLDRDLNASINILNRAVGHTVLTLVESTQAELTMKQEAHTL